MSETRRNKFLQSMAARKVRPKPQPEPNLTLSRLTLSLSRLTQTLTLSLRLRPSLTCSPWRLGHLSRYPYILP